MPKLSATPREKRERALLRAIARGKADQGLEYDCQVAQRIGISKNYYSALKKEKFQGLDLERFTRLAQSLRLTGREVCACVGVPYEDPKE